MCPDRPITRIRQLAITLALSLLVFSGARLAAGPVDYAREVAPILRAYCAGCHNDDELEGDLSVETHSQLLAGGSKRTVRAGDGESSYLIKVLEGRAKPKMPPEDEPTPGADEIALLKRWVDEGARGPDEDVSLFSSLVVPDIDSGGARLPVTAAAASADGGMLAVARFGEVELRPRGGAPRRWSGLPGKINALAFSADGSTLLAGGGITGLRGLLLVWDLGDLEAPPREIEAGRDLLYDAEFSPDSSLIASAGYDRVVRIWRSDSGELVHGIDGHKGAVLDLAFHPSGEAIATASADETVKLWRVADGERLDTLSGPAGEQFALSFTPDGKYLLAGGADNRIRMWRMLAFDRARIQPLVHARFAHEGAVERIMVGRGGRSVVSAGDDRSLKLWSLPDLRQLRDYGAQADLVSALVTEPDRRRRFIAYYMDGGERSHRRGRLSAAGSEAQVVQLEDLEPAEVTKAQGAPVELAEAEPNDSPAEGSPFAIPARVTGEIGAAGDSDLFRFDARRGQRLVFEIDAARSKSKLDSKLEVLDAGGAPVEQVVLQSVRDSWFTFRGKDSQTSDDFRLHNWREMELNDYLYAGGEVTKLWLYPRGPDSGFKVYPGFGKRHCYFNTTPITHALGKPCYVVRPFPPGAEPAPNGLPVFRLYYENDDDPQRQFGSDSRLSFTAPEDGEYLVRVSDVRGFGAAEGYGYTLIVRNPDPRFTVSVGGKDPKLVPGTGKPLSFTANREDGFAGQIEIRIDGVPDGYRIASPVVIEAGQLRAFGTFYAEENAPQLSEEEAGAIRVTARARVADEERVQELGDLGKVELGGEAKLKVSVAPADEALTELVIRPGETVYAVARVERLGFGGRVEFGRDDSGKSLPHGVYVDNIGLNGLMIVEGQSERQFAITAAPWVQPREGWLVLDTGADGGRSSAPMAIRVAAE